MKIALKSWFSIFFRRYFDVRMRSAGGIETRLIERPGKWMPAKDLDALIADLRQVAGQSLAAGTLGYGVFSADRSRMEQSIITLVRDQATGQPLAFNALVVMDFELAGRPVQVLHLGLVMIDPSVRGRGLSWILYGLTCFLLFLRNRLRPLWVSNVTQVPAVAGMVSESFSEVFPGPEPGPRRSLTHLLLARQIMQGKRPLFGVGPEAGFDETRFVITNAYTGGSQALKKTFAQVPLHRDAAYNAFCAERLDYDRGDDLLQIGQITLRTARNYLTGVVPRNSLASLALLAVALVVQLAVLPVLMWFDADRPWGRLRPWQG